MEEKIEKRVLLAVDDSTHALKAAEYIARIFKEDEYFNVNLIHVMPPLPPIIFETHDDIEFKRWQMTYRPKLEKKYKEKANSILEKVITFLKGLGWTDERFEKIALSGRSGPAPDLLFYAEQGLFDALVLGRRGISKWEKIIVGSVTDKIIHAEKTIPIWIVVEPVPSKKVLIAIDGSENALRAADHVGFIFSGRNDIEIILIHIIKINFIGEIYPEKWQKAVEKVAISFIEKAKTMLIKAGFSEKNVKTVIKTTTKDIAKEILEYQEKENIGTIAMGRRGISRLKSFFLGSVSNKVLNMIEKGAVWVVD